MTPHFSLLSDSGLLDEVDRLAGSERCSTVELIVALWEVDRRRLFAPAGYSSLFAYCTQRLRLSEGAAYARIEAARASHRFPAILPGLADGSLTLSTVGLIGRHLTEANCAAVLDKVRYKSKRDVERIIAALMPMPDAPTMVRKLPASSAAGRTELAMQLAPAGNGVSAPAAPDAAPHFPAPLAAPVAPGVPLARADALPSHRPVIAPLAPERFKLQITMSRGTHDTLREIQELIRHSVPSGDAAIVVARALTLLRDHLLRQKAAQTRRPRVARAKSAGRATGSAGIAGGPVGRATAADNSPMPPASRNIPAQVRRAVWLRDGAGCAFVGADGRCGSRSFLEFHHVRPFAAGGPNDESNIELRCREHNALEAEMFFGKALARARADGRAADQERAIAT